MVGVQLQETNLYILVLSHLQKESDIKVDESEKSY